jgi:hypothetical protein
MEPIEQRACACCGVEFVRKRFDSGRLEDLTAFKKRRFVVSPVQYPARSDQEGKSKACFHQEKDCPRIGKPYAP